MELGRLIADIPTDHPLAQWASNIRGSMQRPDFRRKRYRDEVQAERRREQVIFMTQLRKAIAVSVRLRQQEEASLQLTEN